jgi:tRNA(Ile)-lysidine synthase
MASSRNPASASARAFLQAHGKKRIAVGLSGGIDSVVLLHLLKHQPGLCALHVHHGLSPNADAWAAFCRRLCRQWRVPLKISKVEVRRSGKGLEAAAREARYAAFGKLDVDMIALAHHLDDQAETVLMNLLRGAGLRGASGMQPLARFEDKLLARPLLGVSRAQIEAYARAQGLEWIDDESNADEGLTRNFLRRRVGPLLETRFPDWRRALARAARLFSEKDDRAARLLREFLRSKNLKAPSEAKLVEMLRQLTGRGDGIRIQHDGTTLRVHRSRLVQDAPGSADFAAVAWKGEPRLKIPALGGELRFTAGEGIASEHVRGKTFHVRLRSGGERLQVHPRRPRRTLKNLFQEAGVPSWARQRTPLLFCGEDLVWVPGLGVDVRYRGRGVSPEWILSVSAVSGRRRAPRATRGSRRRARAGPAP